MLFNNGQSIVGNSIVFDKDTVSHITKELADILAYVLELENKIDDLQIKFDESQITAVELVGEKF